jgi:peptidoglycan/LPS O-acetylase OafA/YrhL
MTTTTRAARAAALEAGSSPGEAISIGLPTRPEVTVSPAGSRDWWRRADPYSRSVSVTSGELTAPGPGEGDSPSFTVAPNLTPPPGNPRFPIFDSLRAIAALCVFAGHTVTGTYTLAGQPGLFTLAAHVADEGVAIFFLISGFLLYRPFLTARRGHPLSLAGYARRRVLRIVPAYWVALSIFLALGVVSGVNGGNWWIFYGFGQVYRYSTVGSGVGVAWTLCIEVTFYAALPGFAFVAARLWRGSLAWDFSLLAVLAVASLAYRAHFSSIFDLAKVSTLAGTFFWFALGMTLALASVSERWVSLFSALGVRLRHWPTLSWIVALALFLALHELFHHTGSLGFAVVNVVTHALYGLVAFFLLLPAVFEDTAGGLVRRLLSVRLLAWIGLISYAFYLYHTIVIAQLNRFILDHGIGARYAIVTVGALIISLGAAAASFYLLERPVMRMGERRRAAGNRSNRPTGPAR